MTYDTDYYPTTAEADDGPIYIATWDDEPENDGEAGTYDEPEYDAYERRVLAELDGEWETETDDTGVFLQRRAS